MSFDLFLISFRDGKTQMLMLLLRGMYWNNTISPMNQNQLIMVSRLMMVRMLRCFATGFMGARSHLMAVCLL
jgi:hypothetical protein